jgi:hypothetical protein
MREATLRRFSLRAEVEAAGAIVKVVAPHDGEEGPLGGKREGPNATGEIADAGRCPPICGILPD